MKDLILKCKIIKRVLDNNFKTLCNELIYSTVTDTLVYISICTLLHSLYSKFNYLKFILA